MAQVRWSLTAGNDLQDIENFIARDSVLHAITFVDRVVESAETLLKTPQRHRMPLFLFEMFFSGNGQR
jgi:plasmid stabilization system protein ParE